MPLAGFAGTQGSGKGFATNVLEKHGFTNVMLSQYLRHVAIEERKWWKEKKDEDRQKLRDLGDEFRRTLGPGYLVKKTLELYSYTPGKLFCIDGLRNPGEVLAIREAAPNDNIIVAIDADKRLRFERMMKRAKETGRPNNFTTWEEFLREDEAEDHGPEYGQRLRPTMEYADLIMLNDFTPRFEQNIISLLPYFRGELPLRTLDVKKYHGSVILKSA